MARKDLSRTVIEGGRYYHNSYFRRASHGIERASTREWLDRVAVDLDEADETAPPPRPRVHKMFRDKLAPAQRWLVAQVGRPWSKVFSDLCARFDTRTVAGRHIVHDHMLTSVRQYGDVQWRRHTRFDLVVDRHGILRKAAGFGRSWQKLRAEVLAWADGRMCAKTHRGWWWFRAVGASYHGWRVVPAGPMSPGQIRYVERLSDDLRDKVVIKNPWR